MKRIIGTSLILLLVVPFCFAQQPRDPGTLYTDLNGSVRDTGLASANTTILTNLLLIGNQEPSDIGVGTEGTGSDNQNAKYQGTPSFIALTSNFGDSANAWYLWVDIDGDLMIASHTTLNKFSSFPSGIWQWDDGNTGVTTVGEQT